MASNDDILFNIAAATVNDQRLLNLESRVQNTHETDLQSLALMMSEYGSALDRRIEAVEKFASLAEPALADEVGIEVNIDAIERETLREKLAGKNRISFADDGGTGSTWTETSTSTFSFVLSTNLALGNPGRRLGDVWAPSLIQELTFPTTGYGGELLSSTTSSVGTLTAPVGSTFPINTAVNLSFLGANPLSLIATVPIHVPSGSIQNVVMSGLSVAIQSSVLHNNDGNCFYDTAINSPVVTVNGIANIREGEIISIGSTRYALVNIPLSISGLTKDVTGTRSTKAYLYGTEVSLPANSGYRVYRPDGTYTFTLSYTVTLKNGTGGGISTRQLLATTATSTYDFVNAAVTAATDQQKTDMVNEMASAYASGTSVDILGMFDKHLNTGSDSITEVYQTKINGRKDVAETAMMLMSGNIFGLMSKALEPGSLVSNPTGFFLNVVQGLLTSSKALDDGGSDLAPRFEYYLKQIDQLNVIPLVGSAIRLVGSVFATLVGKESNLVPMHGFLILYMPKLVSGALVRDVYLVSTGNDIATSNFQKFQGIISGQSLFYYLLDTQSRQDGKWVESASMMSLLKSHMDQSEILTDYGKFRTDSQCVKSFLDVCVKYMPSYSLLSNNCQHQAKAVIKFLRQGVKDGAPVWFTDSMRQEFEENYQTGLSQFEVLN